MILPDNVLRNRYAIHQYVAKYSPATRLYYVSGREAVLRDPGEPVPAAGRYRYVIECNATMRESASRKRRRAPDPVAWLRRKSQGAGFVLLSARIIHERAIPFLRHGVRGVHMAVEIVGVLRVTDPVAFAHPYHGGLGAAKRFGYGMLRLEAS